MVTKIACLHLQPYNSNRTENELYKIQINPEKSVISHFTRDNTPQINHLTVVDSDKASNTLSVL